MAGKEGNIKVSIQGVEKKYNTRKGEVVALNGVDFDIKENEFICVIGPSGCGKSTLLNIIAGLFRAYPADKFFITENQSTEQEQTEVLFFSSTHCFHG